MKTLWMEIKKVKAGRALGSRVGPALVAITALAMFVFSAPVLAGNKFANGKATVDCSLDGSDLTVTVGFDVRNKTGNDPLPDIDAELVTLQAHFTRNEWVPLAPKLYDTEMEPSVNDTQNGTPGDSTSDLVEEVPFSFMVDLCSDGFEFETGGSVTLADANALRAVLELAIGNANEPKRKTGNIFLDRCTSFEPPVCNSPVAEPGAGVRQDSATQSEPTTSVTEESTTQLEPAPDTTQDSTTTVSEPTPSVTEETTIQ